MSLFDRRKLMLPLAACALAAACGFQPVYAPGAAGNLATGALARFLAASGFEHGLDLDRLNAAAVAARALREEPA